MNTPWLKFYPSDWRSDPALRLSGLAARGLWTELLCIMHEAEPRGYLVVGGASLSNTQIASLIGATPKEVAVLLAELKRNGVLSETDDGVIYSRRMVRDTEKAARDKANGKTGGAPNVRRGSAPKTERVRPYRKADAPEKTARIFQKTQGRCFWCHVALVVSPASDAEMAAGFHVDHLRPVCDGGSNDEENLVPACAVCNHDRSKIGWPLNSRRGVDPTLTRNIDPTLTPGRVSDTKAQKLEAREEPSQDEGFREGSRLGAAPVVVRLPGAGR